MTDNKQYPEMPEPTAWRTYDNLLKRARYNAMPITSMQPGVYSHTQMFTEDQMRAYVDADRAMRAARDAEDAARYRYLTLEIGSYCITDAYENSGGVLKEGAADAAIDAIREGQGKG